MNQKIDEPQDFIRAEGLPFLAHLLRRLSDGLVAGFEEWYPGYGVLAPTRTASTMRVLYRKGPLPVMLVAQEIRQSHPLVITWIRQLLRLGLVTTTKDPSDGRKSIVALTPAGRLDAERMIAADATIERAYRSLFAEADADVFDALWRLEQACRRRGMASRLHEAHGAADSPF
ncbi:MAG: DNA-binding MarR family transcriptional regulator [Brevundimonas sp.]|jgi:DNA-binding MarR family transcriptional regulator|uniref:MarR family winged helix-turn-helix transcriptional regulator n=1 Tax=Brevundimonas sp. TaxID=1871086 RepID=UPI0039E57FAF